MFVLYTLKTGWLLAFVCLYLFNPGCPCMGISTLDVLMSPDIGRNKLCLVITDRVHTVGFKQRLNRTTSLKVISTLLRVLW